MNEHEPVADQGLMNFQRLDVYVAAIDLASSAHRVTIADGELRDQVRRATKSAFLNLCEGLPARSRSLGNRYFTSAIGSLCEAHAALDLARAIEVIDAAQCDRLQRLTVRVTQMMRKLRK